MRIRFDKNLLKRGGALFSFLAASYLMMAAIVATVNFDQKLDDPNEPYKRLSEIFAESLKNGGPQSLNELTDQGSSLSKRIATIESQTENIPLAEYVRDKSNQLETYSKRLQEHIKGFSNWAKEEQNILVQRFELQNRGRIGLRQTEVHLVSLVNFYNNKWVLAWTETAENCHSAIDNEYAKFTPFIETANLVLTARGIDFPQWPIPSLGDLLIGQCNFSANLAQLHPPDRGSADYGLFGAMAEWLLKTESRDLALITGMIGFGLFGALAASFIRVEERPIDKREASGAQKGIFVRGLAASVVVYLVIVGGLAVFARDATPNAYAVYFACLVAAVFSEDVWGWARRRQQETLGRTTAKSTTRF